MVYLKLEYSAVFEENQVFLNEIRQNICVYFSVIFHLTFFLSDYLYFYLLNLHAMNINPLSATYALNIFLQVAACLVIFLRVSFD